MLLGILKQTENGNKGMKKIFFSLLPIILFIGCSINKMAIRRTTSIIEKGIFAIYEEEDLELARTAIKSNIKLLEVLLKNDPENKDLKLLLAQAYGAYALGFLEDENKERARYFYKKGRDYALDILRKNKKFNHALQGSLEELKLAVHQMDKDWVPALFWCGFNWGGYIAISLNNPKAIFDLAKVETIMQRVAELDESYYFGGVHLFFGSMAGARPKLLGGDPAKAKSHFERALELTDGKFLLVYVYYAKYYAMKVLDEEKFDELIDHVLKADLNILPEYKLINQIAKQKALQLKQEKEEIF